MSRNGGDNAGGPCRNLLRPALAALLVVFLVTLGGCTANRRAKGLGQIEHLVVIYQENHSFDNLWGSWPGVDGLDQPSAAASKVQVDQAGRPFRCLFQNDVNLSVPTLAASCSDALVDGSEFRSHFSNGPFRIEDYIPATATTCFRPAPAALDAPKNGVVQGKGDTGGCTRDLVHRYYQEQYQLHGGRMDRYATGSDAVGLTMGHYDTSRLPLFRYLSDDPRAPHYVIADHFFQAAFGGSFLNHQWLIAAATPLWPGADASGTTTGCATGTKNCDLHSVVDANGMPKSYPLYATKGSVQDGPLTEAAGSHGTCRPSYPGSSEPPSGTACGDYAVNTLQPLNQPYDPSAPLGRRLLPLATTTIGDELSAAGVSWNWYSAGWDNAAGNVSGRGWTNGRGPSCADPSTVAQALYPNCPSVWFQFHHQPFAYFAHYAPGTPGRSHLKDEADFLSDLRQGNLPAVSFMKLMESENEHPGSSLTQGEKHLVELIRAVVADQRDWPSTAIIVTYDEFGGAWDHVPPPRNVPGVSDRWGPGTRVPAMVLSPALSRSGVDHTQYDTTSILATIEHRWNLPALGSRDAHVAGLAPVFSPRASLPGPPANP